MGNYGSNYYNTINKKGWFLSKHVEIKNMENMFRKHLNEYIVQSSIKPNEEIKIILYINDFYDLLGSHAYKGYMQIYERKLCGYLNPEMTEELITSNREIQQYLYDIINGELIDILEKYYFLETLIKTNYFVVKKLTKKIQKLMLLLDELEGDKLSITAKQLVQMINSKKKLMSELTENGLIFLSDNDADIELQKIANIVERCNIVLKRTRHSIPKAEVEHIADIDISCSIEPSAPPLVEAINIEKK